MTGGPELTAAVAGSNEFTPGEEVILKVNIENRGLIDMKFVQSTTISREDLPNTAKLVRAGLSPGDSPLVVKTDPQMIGDIGGGKTVQVAFSVKVPTETPAGVYTLPLQIDYTYLHTAEQYGQDAIQYTYREVNRTLPLFIDIEPRAHLNVISVASESLNAGTQGFLVLKITNDGSEDARDAVVQITRNGASPIVPTDSSLFVGDLPAGGTLNARFKVAVSREAEAGTYPLDLGLRYTDWEGDTVDTDVIPVGVPVGGKIEFAVASPPDEVRAGSKKVIEVEYRNEGSTGAKDAQARISAVDPFTSSDDTAYLGDLEPGQTATARYEVSVDGGATLKEYGLDSEIRYRDALDNSAISDTLKVRVRVIENDMTPLIAGIVLLVLAAGGAAYYMLVWRKKKE
ncbi:MAG: S-layer protein [Methanolinea sp.]|nr:S-layer protein [Methanolinea sp.]